MSTLGSAVSGLVIVVAAVGSAFAAPNQTREDKARDARMAESAKVAKETKEREELRDRTHDGRLRLERDSSLGFSRSETGTTVNVRRGGGATNER